MESVVQFMSWLESPASNIDLSVNQAFSVPFYTIHDKKLRLVIFTYTKVRNLSGIKHHPDSAFYFETESPDHWFRQRILPEFLPPDRDRIFPRVPKLKGYTEDHETEVYRYLLRLTDRLMSGQYSQTMLKKYAAGLNTITPQDLVPYYLHLGGDYFDWVRSYF